MRWNGGKSTRCFTYRGPGRYTADICRDDLHAADGLAHVAQKVDQTQMRRVELAAAGGVVARLRPLAP
jgi:hypothetical protein